MIQYYDMKSWICYIIKHHHYHIRDDLCNHWNDESWVTNCPLPNIHSLITNLFSIYLAKIYNTRPLNEFSIVSKKTTVIYMPMITNAIKVFITFPTSEYLTHVLLKSDANSISTDPAKLITSFRLYYGKVMPSIFDTINVYTTKLRSIWHMV